MHKKRSFFQIDKKKTVAKRENLVCGMAEPLYWIGRNKMTCKELKCQTVVSEEQKFVETLTRAQYFAIPMKDRFWKYNWDGFVFHCSTPGKASFPCDQCGKWLCQNCSCVFEKSCSTCPKKRASKRLLE